MLPRRTIVTLAYLGFALVATVAVVVIESKLPAPSEVLLKVRADALVRLDIAGPAGKTALERDLSRWTFLKPVEDWADSTEMGKVVQELSQLRCRETLADGELKDSVFGLSSSKAINLRLGFEQEKAKPERLLFGRSGPFENTVYARLEGHEDRQGVYLVETPLRPVLLDPGDYLRDRRLFAFPAGAVRSYTFRQGNLDIELTRDEKTPRWFLTKPIQCRANDDIAYSILEELSSMRAAEFMEDRALPAGTQVNEGAATFVIRPQQGDPVRVTLESRGSSAPSGSMLAHVGGRTTVLQIADDLVSRLPRALEQFRFPNLVEFDKETVARITIESRDDPTVELKSDGRRWDLISNGQTRPANEERIKRLLDALLAEPVLDFRSNSLADLERFGLDRPDVRLTIVTSSIDASVYEAYQRDVKQAQLEGRDPASVPAPKVDVERHVLGFRLGPDGILNVNLAGTPFIYGIDPALLSSSVPTHPLKWRDNLILAFNLFETRGLEIAETGMPEVKLTYDYLQNSWAGTWGGTPVDRQIDVRRAERLVATLGNLRARDFLTSRAEAYQALRNPTCVVKLRTAGRGGQSDVERTLRLAAAVRGAEVEFYFGQFEGDPDVFVIDAATYGRIVSPVIRPSGA